MAKLSVSSRNTEAFTCCSSQTVPVRLALYNQTCRNGLKPKAKTYGPLACPISD
ncbi:hypothetical protein DPMN_099551 [Dreissena polymorpha]|uniref:Uncharacterized protein n=1 Tax=Dreissena polymorpha TaxID=45954 RepID=A0A9D4LE87_DREPO|nr:hypothetical protein DPMN_099551 [Dreissena polymorpha]